MRKRITTDNFKLHCLAILDKVQAKRQEVVITKGGKPIAKLVPVEQDVKATNDDIFGFFKGKVEIKGDIVSPALTPEEWGPLLMSPLSRAGVTFNL